MPCSSCFVATYVPRLYCTTEKSPSLRASFASSHYSCLCQPVFLPCFYGGHFSFPISHIPIFGLFYPYSISLACYFYIHTYTLWRRVSRLFTHSTITPLVPRLLCSAIRTGPRPVVSPTPSPCLTTVRRPPVPSALNQTERTNRVLIPFLPLSRFLSSPIPPSVPFSFHPPIIIVIILLLLLVPNLARHQLGPAV